MNLENSEPREHSQTGPSRNEPSQHGPSQDGPNSKERRVIWGVLLLVAAAFLGLAAGTAIGARFFVPAGSGLAGPAIALGYGLVGVAITSVLAGLLIWRGSLWLLRLTTLGAMTVAILLVGFLTWRAVVGQNQRNAELGLDQPLPEPESWTLNSRLPESNSKRSYREIEVDAKSWTFHYVAVGPEAARCKAELTGAEATALASQVAALVKRLESSPLPCTGFGGPSEFFLTLRDAPGTPFRELEASAVCLKNESDLAELAFSLRRLPIDAIDRAQVECQ